MNVAECWQRGREEILPRRALAAAEGLALLLRGVEAFVDGRDEWPACQVQALPS